MTHRPISVVRETEELTELPVQLQKGRRGVYIVLDSGSNRSSARLGLGGFPTVISLGTKDQDGDRLAWFLGHEIAHVKLKHGSRMGMRSEEALVEETDAWHLARKWNPDIPDKFIEDNLDTYRKVRRRR